MYNLFITSKSGAWNGAPYALDRSRCIRSSEYSDDHLAERFEGLTVEDLAVLRELPCIFAYEGQGFRTAGPNAPKYGFLRDISLVDLEVRIQYELRASDKFLTAQQMFDFSEELGIDSKSFEMTRTHWAVKDVDLPAALRQLGIIVPATRRLIIDILTHTFDVALSFPGEARQVVKSVAAELVTLLGSNSVFYDNNYKAQLARPNLNLLLQDIYRNRAKLVVVFLSEHYQQKEWCGVEFRAIQEIIQSREDKVMFIRTAAGEVKGVFRTDGYIDAQDHSVEELARFICERIELIDRNNA